MSAELLESKESETGYHLLFNPIWGYRFLTEWSKLHEKKNRHLLEELATKHDYNLIPGPYPPSLDELFFDCPKHYKFKLSAINTFVFSYEAFDKLPVWQHLIDMVEDGGIYKVNPFCDYKNTPIITKIY